MVCPIFYITLATLRRRPGGSQKGALRVAALLWLGLWRLLCEWLCAPGMK